MSRFPNGIVAAVVMAACAVSCFGPAAPEPMQAPTVDIRPMVEAAVAQALAPTPTPTLDVQAMVEAAIDATLAAAPTSTPRPTETPFPTPTSRPTYTPVPTATPIPTPTPSPLPTATTQAYQQPTQPTTHWSETGYWYRDLEFEHQFNQWLKAEGYDQDARFVSLDSVPTAWASEIYLTFGCFAGKKVAYFFRFDDLVPSEVDTYVIGIWDTSAEAWKEGDVHFYYEPILTDDRWGIYIFNQTQVRQMFSIVQKADRQANQHQALNAGMFAEKYESIGFWGEFDVTGVQDVVEYLPCF